MAIEKATMLKAKAEAKRFLAALDRYEDAAVWSNGKNDPWGGKEAAAMKRASMDLSRALADLRQGR